MILGWRLLSTSIVWFCVAGLTVAAETIYNCDFQRKQQAPAEWDFRELTNSGPRQRYLGDLGSQAVNLKLEKLPPHAFVRIRFDLLIIGSWDGAAEGVTSGSEKLGPDIFQLRAVDGLALIRATFSNDHRSGEQGKPNLQSFPEWDPRILVAPRTGSARTEMAGYAGDLPTEQSGFTVYRPAVTFAHSATTLTLEFAAENLEQLDNESWGLDNVTVEVLQAEEIQPLTAEQLRDFPRVLRAVDPLRAAEACQELALRPAQTIELVRKLQPTMQSEDPAEATRRKRVRELVQRLEAPMFVEREAAFRELRAIGPTALGFVDVEFTATRSPEVRERLQQLIGLWAGRERRYSPEVLLRMRLTRVLERINTPESLALTREMRGA